MHTFFEGGQDPTLGHKVMDQLVRQRHARVEPQVSHHPFDFILGHFAGLRLIVYGFYNDPLFQNHHYYI